MYIKSDEVIKIAENGDIKCFIYNDSIFYIKYDNINLRYNIYDIHSNLISDYCDDDLLKNYRKDVNLYFDFYQLLNKKYVLVYENCSEYKKYKVGKNFKNILKYIINETNNII